MRYTSGFLILAAVGSVIMPLHAEAQPRPRQIGQGVPLVLRVTPRSSYGRIPLYLVGSTYKPTNAFDPIELAPPLGSSASNITITLPISSARCRIETIKGIRYASPGCLDLSFGAYR
jgi:hypothetical protein